MSDVADRDLLYARLPRDEEASAVLEVMLKVQEGNPSWSH